MIKLTVAYPYSEGTRFDHDYYRDRHCPMAHDLLRSQRYEIDKGLSGPAAESPPAFHAMAHFYFDTLDAFRAGMGDAGATLGADIPNYTNAPPSIQISEVTAY